MDIILLKSRAFKVLLEVLKNNANITLNDLIISKITVLKKPYTKDSKIYCRIEYNNSQILNSITVDDEFYKIHSNAYYDVIYPIAKRISFQIRCPTFCPVDDVKRTYTTN